MTVWFVSRHQGAVDWIQQHGRVQIDKTIHHLEIDQVKCGDVVIGTLPVHLAASVCKLGARYIHLTLDMTRLERGQELDADAMDKCNARLEGYLVERADGD